MWRSDRLGWKLPVQGLEVGGLEVGDLHVSTKIGIQKCFNVTLTQNHQKLMTLQLPEN